MFADLPSDDHEADDFTDDGPSIDSKEVAFSAYGSLGTNASSPQLSYHPCFGDKTSEVNETFCASRHTSTKTRELIASAEQTDVSLEINSCLSAPTITVLRAIPDAAITDNGPAIILTSPSASNYCATSVPLVDVGLLTVEHAIDTFFRLRTTQTPLCILRRSHHIVGDDDRAWWGPLVTISGPQVEYERPPARAPVDNSLLTVSTARSRIPFAQPAKDLDCALPLCLSASKLSTLPMDSKPRRWGTKWMNKPSHTGASMKGMERNWDETPTIAKRRATVQKLLPRIFRLGRRAIPSNCS